MRGFNPAPVLGQPCFHELSDQEIADQLGVHRNTVRSWRNGRQLYFSTADSMALQLGLHPVNLWPEWELT